MGWERYLMSLISSKICTSRQELKPGGRITSRSLTSTKRSQSRGWFSKEVVTLLKYSLTLGSSLSLRTVFGKSKCFPLCSRPF